MSLRILKNYLNYLSRSIHIQINRHETVIDIGSGHAPLIRADILCDLLPYAISQRPVAGLYTPPKRFVFGNVLELPFGTKQFDFAYSRALLEHVPDPIKACEEISRIAKKGLLILPSYLWEIMGGSEPHLWIISRKEDKLVVQKKTLKHIELNSQMPAIIRNSKHYENLFNAFYDYFYIDFYWTDNIEIEVVNNGEVEYVYNKEASSIKPEQFHNKFKSPKTIFRKIKVFVFETLRKLFGGVDVDLFSVVVCPFCKQQFEHIEHRFIICKRCNVGFPVVDDIPSLVRECAKNL